MHFKLKETVRAMDVGHGNTKLTTINAVGKVDCQYFPSVVTPASRVDLAAGTTPARDTTIIRVDGIDYEVGPDAIFAIGPNHAHITDHTYVSRPEYRALCLGALAYMQTERIGKLVVGLPVTRMASHAQRLKKLLTGHHRLGPSRSIQVDEVLVIAQPVGGAIQTATAENRYNAFRNETTWTIDVGSGTVDSLVSKGVQILPKRCATHSGGTSAIAQCLAGAVAARHDVELPTLAFDEALRTGSLRIRGRSMSIVDFLPETRPVVDQAINKLMSALGTQDDIDRIVLVGGGARFFKPGIQARFPHHNVTLSDAGIFANVKGFQIAGEQYATQTRRIQRCG